MAAFWRGVESGACALAVSAILRWLFQAPFLPELVAHRLFSLVPMNIFEFFIRNLGSWSKWAAFAGAILLTLGVAGITGWALSPAVGERGAVIEVAWISVALALLGALLVLPLLGFEPMGGDLFPRPRFPAVFAIFIASAAYGAWFVWGTRWRLETRARARSA